ncbi:TetR/AcrR family transcriptional regulator [Staphylococcus canis]|uniref:TetR/AcrR family transcriptional regulator n=1 Tax=Staphylococcus canis TaxID=2724942 RepID=A0ABS0T6C1_9STAP|nr:TetR/AcrR family transcriptional regulator [Staphylococcus canis]MBI5974295.1 TetR/AcrR family transcriptional regulator [Staphylococcus canis]
MNKRDLRIEKTLSKLMNAFLELLEVELLSKITINNICHLANVHRSTFYKHFKDKFDLLHYTCVVTTEPFFELDFTTRLESPFMSIEKTFTCQMIKVLKLQKEDPLFYDVILPLFSQVFSKEVHKQHKEYTFEPLFPVELFSYVYASTIMTINQWRITQNLEFNPKKLDEMYQSLMNSKLLYHEDI